MTSDRNNPQPSPPKSLAGQTVLVTGGTGFLGGRLVEKLVIEHGARVRVLVRNFARASRIARFPVETVSGDITDAALLKTAVRGCSVVFHCAYANSGNAREQWATNVGATEALADAVMAEGVPRLVHVSTLAVYGKTPDGPIDETQSRKKWHSPYARTKREAEEKLLRRFQSQGLPVVVLQPSVIYGPYSNWTVLPLEWLVNDWIVLVDGGEGLCNCVFVDDVADALLLAATREGVLGETFIVSSEKPVTWKEFFGAYERMLGVNSTVSIPAGVCRRHAFWKRATPPLFAKVLARLRTHPAVVDRLRRTRLLDMPGLSGLRARFLLPPSFGEPSKKVVQWPDPTQIDQGAMRSRPSIEKATTMLVYRPRFDFETGMALTREWAQWANLLPAEEPATRIG